MTIDLVKPPRGAFVNGIAWLFIGLSSVSVLKFIFKDSSIEVMVFVKYQSQLYIGICLATLLSAAGLLKRSELARKIFIGSLVLWGSWGVYAMIFAKVFYKAIIPLYSITVVVLIFLWFAWIIYKLSTKKVIAEFI